MSKKYSLEQNIRIVKTLLDTVKQECDELKPELVAYINNEEIPLQKRIIFWLDAPNELKEEHRWVMHLTRLNGEEISLYDDIYMDRGVSKTVTQVVSTMQDRFMDEGLSVEEIGLENEHLIQQFMVRNVYKFTNDW